MKVKDINRRGVTSWERQAWIGLAFGQGLPIALVFLAPELLRPIAVPVFFIFVASCVSVFGLALYRSVRISEHIRGELAALREADLVCGACRRRIIGGVSYSTAEAALVRVRSALENLKCPHCRRQLI